MPTREELLARLGDVQARQMALNNARTLTADERAEHMALRAERAQIEAQLGALSKERLTVTASRTIRASIKYVELHDAQLARDLAALIEVDDAT